MPLILLIAGLQPVHADEPAISPSPYWKNQVAFPYDAFCDRGTSKESVKWIKFTILLEPYDANVVYFQDCRKYVFHYSFATEVLDPFRGMTAQQFNAVSLFEQNQKAILGTVILPPAVVWPTEPQFHEYGIQFVRQDPFTPEEIRDLFQLVKSKIAAPADVEAFYFPTYEQQAVAAANRDWFASQGIPLGSTARWAEGNTCYSQGWAFGPVKFFPGDRIASAYHSGALKPSDILLTDGVPAEVPFVAGIISLVPSTPNSHVAILARTYAVPFVHLVLAEDAQRAQDLVGRRILLTAYDKADGTCEVKLIDTDGLVDDATAAQILQLKRPTPLNIAPMASLGVFGVSTEGLSPSDVRYVGGKASNFSILRRAVPDNSPRAMVLTFDLWNAFLDQPLTPAPAIQPDARRARAAVGRWRVEQGPTHTSFRLSKDGEWLGLFDVDGATLLDSVQFGPQTSDVSFGRSVDGGDTWQSLTSPTPGQPNAAAQIRERVRPGHQRDHGGQQADRRGPLRKRRIPGLDRVVQRLAGHDRPQRPVSDRRCERADPMAGPSGGRGADAAGGDRPAIVEVHVLPAGGHADALARPGLHPQPVHECERHGDSAMSFVRRSSTFWPIRSTASTPMPCCDSAARRTSRTAPTSSGPDSTTATAAVWPTPSMSTTTAPVPAIRTGRPNGTSSRRSGRSSPASTTTTPTWNACVTT